MPGSHRIDPVPFLIRPGSTVDLRDHDPRFTAGLKNRDEAREALLEDVSDLAVAQELLWASKQFALIILFQGMDASGKDGTIKHVMSGVNPQGVSVHSFRAPTDEERLHHFLWRAMRVTPERGRIAIFNRSYYEEVLIVRVHPELLERQWRPGRLLDAPLDDVWRSRYEDINLFELTSSHNNVVFLKFFLNMSRSEQRKRFLKRLNEPAKHWKFSAADIDERAYWDDYQRAIEDMLGATSTKAAPWYVIPADRKWFTRACVADIIARRIRELDLKYPTVGDRDRLALEDARRRLEEEPD